MPKRIRIDLLNLITLPPFGAYVIITLNVPSSFLNTLNYELAIKSDFIIDSK
nr:MAG TPA: hypothetical protein [Crassvirales sp.]